MSHYTSCGSYYGFYVGFSSPRLPMIYHNFGFPTSSMVQPHFQFVLKIFCDKLTVNINLYNMPCSRITEKDLSIKILVTMAGRSLFTRQQVLLRKWCILIQLSIKTRFGEFLLNIFRVYLRLKKFSYRNASYRSY